MYASATMIYGTCFYLLREWWVCKPKKKKWLYSHLRPEKWQFSQITGQNKIHENPTKSTLGTLTAWRSFRMSYFYRWLCDLCFCSHSGKGPTLFLPYLSFPWCRISEGAGFSDCIRSRYINRVQNKLVVIGSILSSTFAFVILFLEALHEG